MAINPCPQDLTDELERWGRMCALLSIQLGEGAPAVAVLGGLRGMKRIMARAEKLLAANPTVWVEVNPRLGAATADFLAEALGSDVPDYPPDDLRAW